MPANRKAVILCISLEGRQYLPFTEILTSLPEEEHSDHILDELDKHFFKQEIAHLTLVIAQINLWNRVVRSFGPVPGNYKVREHEMA